MMGMNMSNDKMGILSMVNERMSDGVRNLSD